MAAHASVLTPDSPRGAHRRRVGVGLLDLLPLAKSVVVELGDQLLELDVEDYQGS
jgi:hypothetical protein